MILIALIITLPTPTFSAKISETKLSPVSAVVSTSIKRLIAPEILEPLAANGLILSILLFLISSVPPDETNFSNASLSLVVFKSVFNDLAASALNFKVPPSKCNSLLLPAA